MKLPAFIAVGIVAALVAMAPNGTAGGVKWKSSSNASVGYYATPATLMLSFFQQQTQGPRQIPANLTHNGAAACSSQGATSNCSTMSGSACSAGNGAQCTAGGSNFCSTSSTPHGCSTSPGTSGKCSTFSGASGSCSTTSGDSTAGCTTRSGGTCSAFGETTDTTFCSAAGVGSFCSVTAATGAGTCTFGGAGKCSATLGAKCSVEGQPYTAGDMCGDPI